MKVYQEQLVPKLEDRDYWKIAKAVSDSPENTGAVKVDGQAEQPVKDSGEDPPLQGVMPLHRSPQFFAWTPKERLYAGCGDQAMIGKAALDKPYELASIGNPIMMKMTIGKAARDMLKELEGTSNPIISQAADILTGTRLELNGAQQELVQDSTVLPDAYDELKAFLEAASAALEPAH